MTDQRRVPGSASRTSANPAREATVELLRTADAVQRRLSRVAERHGITLQQYNVLRILGTAPETGLPVLTVADAMIEQTPGVTRLIDRLQRKRLARRVRSAKDRRRVYCRITPAGSALLREMSAEIAGAEQEALRTLTRSEQETLTRLLERVREAHEPKRRRTAPRRNGRARRLQPPIARG